MNLSKYIKLFFWIVLFESISYFLGQLTMANIYPWYALLKRSTLTPPGFVFSIVWTILYALLAVVAWMLFHEKQVSKRIVFLFVLQMIMNWVWTPIFFGLHALIASAIWSWALAILNLILFVETTKKHKTISYLLLPYVIWLFFATYLNTVIALAN